MIELCEDQDACNFGAAEVCDYGTECWDGSFVCDGESCPDLPTEQIDILYNTDAAIGGFQFNAVGTMLVYVCEYVCV